jgi:hypothetical protein
MIRTTRTRLWLATACGAVALTGAAGARIVATPAPAPPAKSAISATVATAATSPGSPAAADTVRWFQRTEQTLMDAAGTGEKTGWDRIMDPTCVITSEEGEVLDKGHFLASLRPLPPGLTGNIAVKELTVEQYQGFAVVRFLADEWESVFGQRLATKYRVTDTFRRVGEDWRMVSSHVSVVTQDPPAQPVPSASAAAWRSFAGTYRLLPDGWTMTVELRGGKLFGGRDPRRLKPFVPLTANAFVLSGSLGEWIFATDASGKTTYILDFRKFEPLIWTRVDAPQAPPTHRN